MKSYIITVYINMIFKTFDSDSNDLLSKIGIIGKSFDQIKNRNNLDLSSSITLDDAGALNVLNKLKETEASVNAGKYSWQKYFSGLEDGEKWQAKFVQNNDLQKASIEDIISASNEAAGSAASYHKGLDKMTLGSKAAAVAAQALSAAGNMVAFTLISKAIEVAAVLLDNWIHRVEKANEAMDQAVSVYENTKSELNSINTELEQQNTRMEELLSKDKLTYAEKSELEELQKITKELMLQEDITERQSGKASKDAAKKTVAAYQTQYGKQNFLRDDLAEAFDTTIESDHFPYITNENDVVGNAAAYVKSTELLTEAQKKYNEAVKQGKDTEFLADDVQYYIDMQENYRTNLDNNISDLQEKRLALEDEYDKAITKRNLNAEPLTPTDQEMILTYESIADTIRFIYEYSDQNSWNHMEFSSIFATEGIEKTKEELIAMASAGKLTEEELKKYPSLLAAIESCDFLGESSSNVEAFQNQIYACTESLENMESKAPDETVLSINDSFSLKDSENNTTYLGTLKEQLSDIEDSYKTCLSAKEEFDEQGYFSISTLEKLLSLGDEYLQYLFDEEGNVRLDAEAFQHLALAKIDCMEAQALKNLADNISQIEREAKAAEYLAEKQDELSDSYENVAVKALASMASIDGFSNSKHLQNAYNSFQSQYEQIKALFANAKKGVSSSYSGKSASPKSDSPKPSPSSASSDPLKDAFTQEYNTLKHNLEMEYLTEKAYYDTLSCLNEKYYAGKEVYLSDYRKYKEEVYKGLQKLYKSTIEAQMNLLEKQLDSGMINYQHYSSTITSLLDTMYSEGKLSAENYYSYTQKMLEYQLTIYDRALKAVTARIDKEIDGIDALIDGLQEQNKALEQQKGDYDSILSVVSNVYDAEIKAIQDQQKAIDDKIQALRDANSEEERAIALQKAHYNLQRAMNQRTKRVYREGQGYVYEADNEAVNTAGQEVRDAEMAVAIAGLEQERDSLNASIKSLEALKQKWTDISTVYDEEMRKQLAIAYFGRDYESIILSGRAEDIEAFQTLYLGIQSQLNDNTEFIASYEEKKAYYSSLKDQWSAITGKYEEETNAQYAQMLLGQNWESNVLSGRIDTLDQFRDEYIRIQQEIAQAAWKAANEIILAARQAEKGAKGQTGSAAGIGGTGNGVSGNHKKNPITPPETTYSVTDAAGKTKFDNLTYAQASDTISIYGKPDEWKIVKNTRKYARGGVVGTKLPGASSLLDRIANRMGEDQMAAVTVGERILTPGQNRQFEKLIASMPSALKLADKISAPDMSRYDFREAGPQPFQFSIGEITLQEVQNTDALAKAIKRDFPMKMYREMMRRY